MIPAFSFSVEEETSSNLAVVFLPAFHSFLIGLLRTFFCLQAIASFLILYYALNKEFCSFLSVWAPRLWGDRGLTFGWRCGVLDDISLKILKILQEKARIPNVEVARQVEMAPSAVLERIRKMERQGVIDGYEVRLNPEQFDRRQIAFVEVRTRSVGDRPDTGKMLAAVPEIQEVHYVAGEDCYLVKLRVADTAELAVVIREKIAVINEVVATRTATVLQTYKETARIPIRF